MKGVMPKWTEEEQKIISRKREIKFYFDKLHSYDSLTDEEFGKLIRAILNYEESGEITEFENPITNFCFLQLKSDADRKLQKYIETSKSRADNGSKCAKQTYGKHNNVRFTDNQYNKLVEICADVDLDEYIEQLDKEIENGNNPKNHFQYIVDEVTKDRKLNEELAEYDDILNDGDIF